MQHDHVLKNLNLDLTHRVGEGVEGVEGRAKCCYHVAALEIPFNLIWNMTII